MLTDSELAGLVRQMDSASTDLHAAMLRFDRVAGLLRSAVNEIRLDRFENAALFDGLRLLASDEIVPDSRHHSLMEAS